MHILGFFKKNLNADEKREMLSLFDQYKQGYVPLVVPLTLVNHYVRKYDQPWLRDQTYLNPHPFELKLRNYF
nr:YbgA family protein [uncultured Desulfobacter sp.]